MTSRLVSVVVPSYNPGRFLAEAIESAFDQTHRDIEVIVVDDGSSEDISAPVRRWPVRFLQQGRRGVSAARNAGVEAATGRFLVFLDADDRLTADAVQVNFRELDAHPAAAFAAGLCRPVDARGDPLPFRQQPAVGGDCYAEMLKSNFIWMPAQVLYRREVFEQSGGFDTNVNACADYDLYLRILREHPVACHRHVVAEYRFHEGNMSSDKALMLASALAVLNRQWPYVRRHAAYRRAYWEGRRFWQQYYGSGLVEDIRAGIKRPGLRSRAVRDALMLLKHHPVEALRQFGRKLRCVALDLVGATR